MIPVKTNTTIYLLIGASATSGGSESTHQLYYNLRELGYNALMFYVDRPAEGETENFKRFNGRYPIKEAQNVVDSADNILIVPETSTSYLYAYKNIQKAIYWLSVDNYYVIKKIHDEKSIRSIVRTLMGRNRFFDIDSDALDKSIYHLTQSRYATDHLKIKGASNIAYIPDYIHESFTDRTVDLTNATRRDIVLYNPAKGIDFTKKLIAGLPELEWKPLVNMTPEQVADALLTSKLYIDFGNHPGKDRFPREAALMGCCVITGKKGSAFYDDDVKIPAGYKFEENQPELIMQCIRRCIHDYNNEIKNFEAYRDFILAHKNILRDQIQKTFVRNFKQPTQSLNQLQAIK